MSEIVSWHLGGLWLSFHTVNDPTTTAAPDDTRGFARVPQLVRALLGGDADVGMPADVVAAVPRHPRQVVLFLLDGFGWSYVERFGDAVPFLARTRAAGGAAKISAQFPSTTAAHMTTLHTGVPAAESGVFEWFYAEPDLGAVFAPLLASTIGPAGLVPVAPDALAKVLPATTLYEDLAARGVRSVCYQHRRVATSPYSRVVTRGAQMRAYTTLPELFTNLVADVRATTAPTYHLVYIDVLDSISHHYGPESPHLAAELRALFGLLEDIVVRGLAGMRPSPALLVTADHGQTAVDPSRTVYLDERIPAARAWMRTGPDGRALVPGGSPRDLFLYLLPERCDEAHATLATALADVADVHRTADLAARGVFGPSPSRRLLERIGDLVILPRPHEMVWWRGGDARFTIDKRGHHGGLTAEEMEIPLLGFAP
jgi:predicted AlkP superfamily pyrophosphatase or phosphodiesterase